MSAFRNWLSVVSAAAALLSCRGDVNETDGQAYRRTAASASSARTLPGPSDLLDSLDQRAHVPLLPMMAHHQKQNMRDHLQAVQEIVSALGKRDFEAVRASAARIGFSQQMGQMCEHMGAAAPGFSEVALQFHHTADTIAQAAAAKSSEGVLKALDQTLAVCAGCHQRYKQQTVTETTWAALSARGASHGGPSPGH